MCVVCGSGHELMLVERPAHRLAGRIWRGPSAEATTDVLAPLVEEVVRARDEGATLWKSPLVCLSWSQGGELVKFVGYAPEGDVPAGFEELDLPEMEFVSRWHAPEDGGVLDGYRALIEALPAFNRRWSTKRFSQREEYPPALDPVRSPSMRLMLPVAA